MEGTWDQCLSSANDLTAASGSLSRNCALLWVPHIPFGVSYSPPLVPRLMLTLFFPFLALLAGLYNSY